MKTSTRVLLGLEPSDVHPRVLRAMAKPLVEHLAPEFLKVMDDIKRMVQETLKIKNELTFVVSALGECRNINLFGELAGTWR